LNSADSTVIFTITSVLAIDRRDEGGGRRPVCLTPLQSAFDQYCCQQNTLYKSMMLSELQKRVTLATCCFSKYQFMRDLIACRDWYNRDSGCILSRDELHWYY